MSLWDDSQWVDGYVAHVNNVFAGGNSAWIDFTYQSLIPNQGTGRVGWRQLVCEQPECVTEMLSVATLAMQMNRALMLRVTNAGQITGVQTVS